LHTLLIMSAIALALMAAVSGLLGWLIAGRVLRPLRTITATAREISASNLDRRLALPGPDDELKELGDTLDALLGRLEIAFESQRQFVSHASHELRTPLARLKTITQVALIDPDAPASSLRSAHQRALATEQQLEELIDALLELASGEHALEHPEPIDLAETTQKLLDQRADELQRRQLVVTAELDRVSCEGSQHLLERLLANLVDNAIRHNAPAGWIKITTTATPPGKATVTVANSGIVIPPHDLDRLTQPFQQLAVVRTGHSDGHGLGLSIVAAITGAHHGSLQLQALAGGGLHIEITLPGPPATPEPQHPTHSREPPALLSTHTHN
jgi:signal transduction histidine kinase